MSALSDRELADAIEKLIDTHGLDHFLSMSGFVAGEKSEHLAVTWQDTTTAKLWMKISAELDKLTAMAEEWQL